MTRHDLKEQLQHDQFSDTVSGAIGFASSHRQQLIRWGIAAALVVIVVSALLWYRSYRSSVRQEDLQAAFNVVDTQVGPHNDFAKTFATPEAKLDASMKALSDVVGKDGGTREGYIAQYYRGTLKAQKGDTAGAEADLKTVAGSRSDSAALAKIALAQLYLASKRTSEAQDLLRSLVNKPTDLVSKAQAEVLLAQLVETVNPQESKHILQQLKAPGQSPAVSRAADQVSSQLPK